MNLALITVFGIVQVLAEMPISQIRPAPQIPRDKWKDCYYQQSKEPCYDRRIQNGIQIIWKSRSPMTFLLQSVNPHHGGRTYRDMGGNLWKESLLPQGNIVLSKNNGSVEIFVPLRFPCKPPAIGEVGYCRYP